MKKLILISMTACALLLMSGSAQARYSKNCAHFSQDRIWVTVNYHHHAVSFPLQYNARKVWIPKKHHRHNRHWIKGHYNHRGFWIPAHWVYR